MEAEDGVGSRVVGGLVVPVCEGFVEPVVPSVGADKGAELRPGL